MTKPTRAIQSALFDLSMINAVPPPVRLFAAAILAVAPNEPTQGELLIIKALGLDDVEEQHVAFAAYVRRVSIGEPVETLGLYLEPARHNGNLHHAWAAVAWLRTMAEAQQSDQPRMH